MLVRCISYSIRQFGFRKGLRKDHPADTQRSKRQRRLSLRRPSAIKRPFEQANHCFEQPLIGSLNLLVAPPDVGRERYHRTLAVHVSKMFGRQIAGQHICRVITGWICMVDPRR